MIWAMDIRPPRNMKLLGLICCEMLLIAICLTRGDIGIRTYPDFGLRIKGFLIDGCLYIQVGRRVIPAMVLTDEVARIMKVGF
jgi:hypothetical protein